MRPDELGFRIRAQRSVCWGGHVQLWAWELKYGDEMLRAAPLVMEAVKGDERYHQSAPFMNLRPDEAQALMDQLWHVGLRPTEGSGSAGSLAATERHLEDMRALVFQVPLPGNSKTRQN